jgi:transposase
MPSETTIHVAIELSVSSWLVATRSSGAEKSRLHHIEGGDTTALLALITELRTRASTKLGKPAEVVCCFEAGRDGFWLHRALTMHGVTVYVLEPTSILVTRRARRAKTDRLDAEGMLRVLAAWLAGDQQVCSMVRVPTPEEGDAKRPHLEREHLVRERLRPREAASERGCVRERLRPREAASERGCVRERLRPREAAYRASDRGAAVHPGHPE